MHHSYFSSPINFSFSFYCATRIHSADYAVARCLSVCHTCSAGIALAACPTSCGLQTVNTDVQVATRLLTVLRRVQVAVSARLAPSHASYRGPELVWTTGHFDVAVPGFGTSCLLHCGHLTVSVNSKTVEDVFVCQGLGCGASWLLLPGAGYNYSYLLTYTSVFCLYSKRLHISSKFHSPSGSPTTLVFPNQTGWQYSYGDPPNGGVECKGYENFTIFNQYLALSRKCCKIEP